MKIKEKHIKAHREPISQNFIDWIKSFLNLDLSIDQEEQISEKIYNHVKKLANNSKHSFLKSLKCYIVTLEKDGYRFSVSCIDQNIALAKRKIAYRFKEDFKIIDIKENIII